VTLEKGNRYIPPPHPNSWKGGPWDWQRQIVGVGPERERLEER